MISSNALERVIEKETFAEILSCLTRQELLTAALRLEGLSDTEIGILLGMSRQAVRQRLHKARLRIIATRPDLAPALRDRGTANGQAPATTAPPLGRGWLSDARPVPAAGRDEGTGRSEA